MGGIELLILVFTGATIHSFFTGKCKMEKTLLSAQNTAETQNQQRTSKIYQLFPGFLVGKTFMMFPHLFAPVPENPSFWLNQASSFSKDLNECLEYMAIGCLNRGKAIIEIKMISISGDNPPHLADHR